MGIGHVEDRFSVRTRWALVKPTEHVTCALSANLRSPGDMDVTVAL
jgi:hypothetical protein